MRKTRSQLYNLLTGCCRQDVDDIADSSFNIIDDNRVQVLTDGPTISWNVSNGWNAQVTLSGNRTLSISNALTGCYYTIRVIQDSTGSRSLSLPSPSKVFNGGNGAITLTPTANAMDILNVYYDGTTYYWNYGLNYT